MKKLLLLLALSCAAFAQNVQINPAQFFGTGTLNDLTAGGRFTSAPENAEYVVTISTVGTPDKFDWTKNGTSGAAAVSITGAAQNLGDGITVTFGATTGHHMGDKWVIDTQANGSLSGTTFVNFGTGAKSRDSQDRMRDEVHVLDYLNIDPKGVTDSSAGFIAAYKVTAPINGGPAGTLNIPCGTYKLSSTLVLRSAFGARFMGAGLCVNFVWAGNTTTPMLWFQDCYACEAGGFQISGNTSFPAKYAIQISTTGTGGIIETLHSFHNIHIEGQTAFYTAIQIDGPVDANNDQQVFREVSIVAPTHSCFTLGNPSAGYNIFDVVIERSSCNAYGAPYEMENFHGSYHWRHSDGGRASVSDFYHGPGGGSTSSIDDSEFEASAAFLTSDGPAGYAAPLRISGVNWDGGCLGRSASAIQANCPAGPTAGDAIAWKHFGPLTITNSKIGNGSTTGGTALSVCLSLGPTGGPGIVFVDDMFGTSLTTTSALMRCSQPARFLDNTREDSAGLVHMYALEYLTPNQIQNINMVNGQVAGVLNVGQVSAPQSFILNQGTSKAVAPGEVLTELGTCGLGFDGGQPTNGGAICFGNDGAAGNDGRVGLLTRGKTKVSVVTPTSTTAVTWVAGDDFSSYAAGSIIPINFINETVVTVIDAQHMTVSPAMSSSLIGLNVNLGWTNELVVNADGLHTATFRGGINVGATSGVSGGYNISDNTGHLFSGGQAVGTVTHSVSALSTNALIFGNGLGDIKTGDLTGDVTTTGTQNTTLANTTVTAGVYGDSTHVAQVGFDGKGRAGAASNILIAPSTITAGSGLSGGGSVAPGGTVTLTNAGVTSLACSGCTVSSSTGAVTLTVTGSGITSVNGFTGSSITLTVTCTANLVPSFTTSPTLSTPGGGTTSITYVSSVPSPTITCSIP